MAVNGLYELQYEQQREQKKSRNGRVAHPTGHGANLVGQVELIFRKIGQCVVQFRGLLFKLFQAPLLLLDRGSQIGMRGLRGLQHNHVLFQIVANVVSQVCAQSQQPGNQLSPFRRKEPIQQRNQPGQIGEISTAIFQDPT